VRWLNDDQDRFLPGILAVAQQAASIYPNRPSSWLRLAALLSRSGDFEAALKVLAEAVNRIPGDLQLDLALAHAHRSLHQHEKAIEITEKVLRRYPNDRSASLLNRHLLLDMENKKPWHEQQNSLTALLSACDSILVDSPGHTDATYYKAKVLAGLGRNSDACSVLALDRHVSITDLPPPPGYQDGEAFRQVLADEIHNNPTLEPDPRRKATRGGLQTAMLWQPNAVAVRALLEQIKSAINDYVANLSSNDETGFSIARPRCAQLNSWAVIYGSEGHQKSHRHPSGWLSGVFYVVAPRKDGETAYRGPLILGALDPKADGIDPPWRTKTVEPVPGRLVLFPSYVPHASESTGVAGARISVAFDVVRVADNSVED